MYIQKSIEKNYMRKYFIAYRLVFDFIDIQAMLSVKCY